MYRVCSHGDFVNWNHKSVEIIHIDVNTLLIQQTFNHSLLTQNCIHTSHLNIHLKHSIIDRSFPHPPVVFRELWLVECRRWPLNGRTTVQYWSVARSLRKLLVFNYLVIIILKIIIEVYAVRKSRVKYFTHFLSSKKYISGQWFALFIVNSLGE